MTTSVSGSAISAISEKSSEPVVNESLVRNSGEMAWPIGSSRTSSATSSASQRPAMARQPPLSWRSKPSSGAAAVDAGVVSGTADVVESAGTADAPSAQARIEAQADQAVERDRDEQQRADRRLLPERIDLQDDQRGRDRLQQQRAE